MDGRAMGHLDFSKVQRAMENEDMDALVAMEPHTVAVLLNYWEELCIKVGFREFPACVVIMSSGEIIAVTPRLNYNSRIENAPWIDQFVGRYTDSDSNNQGKMVQTLARALEKRGLENAKIGFEMGFVPVGIMDWIKSELPGIETVDGEWLLWQLRAVKTTQQLGFIQTAVDACEAGIKRMLGGWKEGESIYRLLDEFDQVVRGYGASFFATHQTATAKKWAAFSGADAVMPGTPRSWLNQRLSEDFIIRANDETEVNLDIVVRCQAYISDWKRAFYLGTPPKEIADLYDFEGMVHQAIVEEIKPGMTTVEAQEACEHRLKKEGMVNSPMFRQWIVHSVGLEIHEEPMIGGCPTVSENGEVDKTKIARFPGLLRDGSQKITFEPNTVVMVETKRTEDPYVMTKEGLKRLNTLPQELFVV